MATTERIVFTLTSEAGEEVEHSLPAKYAVCPRCDGRGTHDHPAFANGITSDEWHSPDWDDESRKRYMSGFYDVACETCDGTRVVLEADEARFTSAQREAWEQHVDNATAMAEEYASERHLRMMESGGRF